MVESGIKMAAPLDSISKIIEQSNNLALMLDKLLSYISGKELSAKLKTNITRIEQALVKYNTSTESLDIEEIINSAKTLATFTRVTITKIPSVQLNIPAEQISEIKFLANSITQQIDNSPSVFERNTTSQKNNDTRLAVTEHFKNIATVKAEYDKNEQRYHSLLSENLASIAKIENSLHSLSESVEEEISKAKALYTEADKELIEKKEEINNLLGVISGTAIAGSFEESSKSEKNTANYLRWMSIALMIAIVIIAGYSFYQSTLGEFSWHTSSFRVALILLLSVPTAYLARESTRHRSQYYKHLQTALELRAINPYLASLPQDEQHRIKAEVAKKFFYERNDPPDNDSYPINLHEIIIELIRKIETKSKS